MSEVELSFAYPASGDPRRTFRVRSHSAESTTHKVALRTNWLKIPSDTPLYDSDGALFARHGTLEASRRAGLHNAHMLIDSFPFGNRSFAAKLQYWARPEPEWLFQLSCSDTVITGGALALLADQLVDLLAQLIVINDRAELIARYQRELRWREPL